MDADFAVFGGGPAGTAAAIGLARGGAKVLLFERGRSTTFKPGEIIEASVQQPLRGLGLWDDFLQLDSLRSAGTLSIWGGPKPLETSSIRNPWGAAFLVDRSRLEQNLLAAAARQGVLVFRCPEGIGLEDTAKGRAVVWSEGGEVRRARPALLVDAVGRARSIAGSGRRIRHDDLVALLSYAPVPSSAALDTRLFIEAASDGWWYSAPLPGGLAVTAFMTDADLIPRGNAHRIAYFHERLMATKLIRQRASDEPDNLLKVAPANSSIRVELRGADWVSVGDAAASYDPLAGVGVVAALSKGAALARLLVNEHSPSRAVDAYVETERTSYAAYLTMRAGIYRREDRWRDRTFWSSRAGASAAGAT